jgi:ferredoxin
VPELRQRLPGQRAAGQPELPQLRFIEKNCVQCGLCATTCPEDAITLQPRLLASPERKQRACSTRQSPGLHPLQQALRHAQGHRAMLGKLAGHSMFQGAALERLKMCGDCRVIDIYSCHQRSEDHRRYE